MNELWDTLASLLSALLEPEPSAERVKSLGPKLLELTHGESAASLDEVLARLRPGFEAPNAQLGGYAALIAGCIVEAGGSAEPLVHALVPRLPPLIADAERTLDALGRTMEDDGDTSATGVWVGDHAVSEATWQRWAATDLASARAFRALDDFCRPLIAALSRTPELLKTPTVQSLTVSLTRLSEASAFAGFLDRLLRVPMDEEWLIIDPRTTRGFALSVSGVANAFQVYALVHAALRAVPRSFGHWRSAVPGPTPAETVLEVARGFGPQSLDATYVPPFTLFRWSAVTQSRLVPDMEDTDAWYSNSAIPAELARFRGARIGLLGEFAIKMSLEVAREFSALKARVKLERELERGEVVDLLAAFACAPRPPQPQPGIGWP